MSGGELFDYSYPSFDEDDGKWQEYADKLKSELII